MDNVSRIMYLPDFNNNRVIRSDFRKGLGEATLIQIRDSLDFVIKGVTPDVDCGDVVLGVFFTNYNNFVWPHQRNPSSGLSMAVFPLYGLRVKYDLQRNDFFANFSGDPIEVKQIHREHSFADSMILFQTNPLENRRRYANVKSLLPSFKLRRQF